MRQPGYPRERPREDNSARFAAAKGVDQLTLFESVTGQSAIKSGPSNHRLPCPFHDDHDPSLIVYPPGRGWWCPVCGKGGDAVAFVAEYYDCGMGEALDMIECRTDIWSHGRRSL
jgi:DNA primase